MTTYIPQLTLPAAIFASPALSILLPVALGSAVGFTIQRMSSLLSPWSITYLPWLTMPLPTAKKTQKTYMALKQPPYRPPPEVFGPAWTVLYGLMGYSAYRAFSVGLTPFSTPTQIQSAKHGFTLYTIQLGLNLVWMPLFFTLKAPIAATVDIVALTGTVGYLTYVWSKVDSVAALALVPYLGWLGFATYLSAGVGYLNDWNTADKEVDFPPSAKGTDTLYVDEK
jgi:benzodiazapine receptor